MMTRLALTLLLGLVMITSGRAQQPEIMRVTSNHVNVRVAPSIDSAIVRSWSRGTTVTVLAREGGWIKMQAPSGSGWIRGDLLAPVSGATGTPASTSAPLPAAAPPPVPAPASPPTAPAAAPAPRAAAEQQPVDLNPPSPHGSAAPSQHVAVELFGGVTFSHLSTTPSIAGIGAQRGFTAGLGVVVPLGQSIGFAIEGSYAQKGAAFSDSAGDVLHYHSDYAEAALLLRPTLAGGAFFLVLGPEVSYELSCQYSVSGPDAQLLGSIGSCSVDGNVRTDFGLIGGAGFKLGPLLLQGRYDLGLRNLYAGVTGNSTKNRSILVSAGVIF